MMTWTTGRSVAVGDRLPIKSNMGDWDDWEVIEIEQPYDDDGYMLEPIVHLKMYCNSAWPLYRMTKQQKAMRKQMPLVQFLELKEKSSG